MPWQTLLASDGAVRPAGAIPLSPVRSTDDTKRQDSAGTGPAVQAEATPPPTLPASPKQRFIENVAGSS
jgi:hypothetical protein